MEANRPKTLERSNSSPVRSEPPIAVEPPSPFLASTENGVAPIERNIVASRPPSGKNLIKSKSITFADDTKEEVRNKSLLQTTETDSSESSANFDFNKLLRHRNDRFNQGSVNSLPVSHDFPFKSNTDLNRRLYHRFDSGATIDTQTSQSYNKKVRNISDIYDLKHYTEEQDAEAEVIRQQDLQDDLDQNDDPKPNRGVSFAHHLAGGIDSDEEENISGKESVGGAMEQSKLTNNISDQLNQDANVSQFNADAFFSEELNREKSGYSASKSSQSYNSKRSIKTRLTKMRKSGFGLYLFDRKNWCAEEYVQQRVLKRNRAFKQSSGHVNIEQTADKESWTQVLELYTSDWFHVVLMMPMWQLTLYVFVGFTFFILVFAVIYMLISSTTDQNCNLNSDAGAKITFMACFGFSLHTAGTVGFGTIDNTRAIYFNCPRVSFFVYTQSVGTVFIHGLLIGLLYQRIGRSDTRSRRVIFSEKALIRCVNGRFALNLQVYDLEKKIPLVECHCRVYAIYSESDGRSRVEFQSHFMRLTNPDDDQGGSIFLAFPCLISHPISPWSPLYPPKLARAHWEDRHDKFVHSNANRYLFPGLILRDYDSITGSRYYASCPICATQYCTDDALFAHVCYERMMEEDSDSDGDTRSDGTHPANEVKVEKERINIKLKASRKRPSGRFYHPRGGVKLFHDVTNHPMLREFSKNLGELNHTKIDMNLLTTRYNVVSDEDYARMRAGSAPEKPYMKEVEKTRTKGVTSMKRKIKHHLKRSNMEILVFVEGIEPNLSGTFQARHSYTYEDIEFDKSFAPCVGEDSRGNVLVDLNKFNQLEDVEPYALALENVTSFM